MGRASGRYSRKINYAIKVAKIKGISPITRTLYMVAWGNARTYPDTIRATATKCRDDFSREKGLSWDELKEQGYRVAKINVNIKEILQ